LQVGAGRADAALAGWQKADCELRGHFSGGHYLSVAALLYATMGDDEVKKKAKNLLDVLGWQLTHSF